MRRRATSVVDSLVLEELGALDELESLEQSYFYVDAYRLMPTFRFLQSTGPWWATQEKAGRVLTGMCVSWANNNPTWRIGVRCLRWTGSTWVRCGFANIMPCQNML